MAANGTVRERREAVRERGRGRERERGREEGREGGRERWREGEREGEMPESLLHLIAARTCIASETAILGSVQGLAGRHPVTALGVLVGRLLPSEEGTT